MVIDTNKMSDAELKSAIKNLTEELSNRNQDITDVVKKISQKERERINELFYSLYVEPLSSSERAPVLVEYIISVGPDLKPDLFINKIDDYLCDDTLLDSLLTNDRVKKKIAQVEKKITRLKTMVSKAANSIAVNEKDLWDLLFAKEEL